MLSNNFARSRAYEHPMQAFHHAHRSRRSDGSGQRRYRSDHSQAVPQADRADRLRPVSVLRLAVPGQTARDEPGLRAEPAGVRRGRRSCSPAATSAADRAASTRRGRWKTTAFASVIAPSFADIFYNNCFKNGMLPIPLGESRSSRICSSARPSISGYELTRRPGNVRRHRSARPHDSVRGRRFRRHCLLNGLDDIGLTLKHEDKITAYEAAHGIQ